MPVGRLLAGVHTGDVSDSKPEGSPLHSQWGTTPTATAATHVAEVGGRGEHVAVRGQEVLCRRLQSRRLQSRADDDVDALDLRVVGAGDQALGELLHRPGGGVVDDQQRGHPPTLPGPGGGPSLGPGADRSRGR